MAHQSEIRVKFSNYYQVTEVKAEEFLVTHGENTTTIGNASIRVRKPSSDISMHCVRVVYLLSGLIYAVC